MPNKRYCHRNNCKRKCWYPKMVQWSPKYLRMLLNCSFHGWCTFKLDNHNSFTLPSWPCPAAAGQGYCQAVYRIETFPKLKTSNFAEGHHKRTHYQIDISTSSTPTLSHSQDHLHLIIVNWLHVLRMSGNINQNTCTYCLYQAHYFAWYRQMYFVLFPSPTFHSARVLISNSVGKQGVINQFMGSIQN